MLVFAGMLTILTATAGPVGLPDSARPGAVRPEQEESSVVPEEEQAVVEPGPQVDALDIPAVIDRPFDVDEGERIIVRQFRLLDAEDLPRFDVNVEEVQALLEQIKSERPEGFTIGHLQETAEEVRSYYRKRGLILAQVIVPVQTVQEGIVDLQVFVGRLGRVLAEGDVMYSSEVLAGVFEDLIGKPISKAEVEAALLRLTDYPGLTVFGVFQPGQLIGTADIVLKVQEEKRFDVALRVDDHGTQETGRNRFRTVIDWNNITGGADRLTFSIQQSYNPKNNVFMALDYERFLSNGYKFRFTGNKNKFDVGGEFAANQVHAESEQQGITLEKSFIRSRVKNFNAFAGYTRKKSTTTTANQPTNIDRLSVFTVGADYDSVDSFTLSDEGGGGINFAILELSHGFNNFLGSMGAHTDAVPRLAFGQAPSRQSGVDQRFASGQFTKLFATYTRLQTMQKNINLLFRSELQWSDDILVPLEQYSMGGPDNVRAFPVAQVLWDRAAFLSWEFLINAPGIADKPAFGNRTWGEILQFTLFYDVAVGRVNEPVLGTDKKDFDNNKCAGVGLRFNMPGVIESKVFWAWEIGGDDVGNERAVQVWGDFTYSF